MFYIDPVDLSNQIYDLLLDVYIEINLDYIKK